MELSKYEREKQSTQNHITKEVTETAIGMMHPSLKDMAFQNMVMKKVLYVFFKKLIVDQCEFKLCPKNPIKRNEHVLTCLSVCVKRKCNLNSLYLWDVLSKV